MPGPAVPNAEAVLALPSLHYVRLAFLETTLSNTAHFCCDDRRRCSTRQSWVLRLRPRALPATLRARAKVTAATIPTSN